MEPPEQRNIFCFRQNQTPHFPLLLPTSALRFMVQRDFGLPCLCIALIACSTAQTTFWPLCPVFSDSDICAVLPNKPEDSKKLQDPSSPLLYPLVGTAEPGQVSGVKSPTSQEDPLVCHPFVCKVDHSNSLCHFSIGQDLTRGRRDPTALEAPDAVFCTVSFQVRTAL